ncbi:MAG: Uma2 family endonuclease, partial [Myxococcota bacterium]
LVEIESLGLKLGPWEGTFEQQTGTWLRFWDLDGELLLTGDEKAEAERHKAEAERQKADLLAAKLRELGVDPDAL